MNPTELRKLRDQYRTALRDDVIPFWQRHSPDREHGGYFTCLNRDGSVYDTDKFVWLQARQVWMFSKFYNALEPRPEFLELATLGAKFLVDHGRAANGDWYFALDRAGRPLVQPYNIFSDCFASMALAQYGRAARADWATDLATKTFERIRQRWDNPKGPYNKIVPGTRPMKSLVLPMITVNLAMEVGAALPTYPVEKVIRENLHALLDVLGFGRLLFLDHLEFDGVFEFLGQGDVVDDDVFDDQQAADLLAGDLKRMGFDLLAVFDNLLGALQRDDLFERLLHPRLKQAGERLAIIALKERGHRGLGNAKEHAQFDVDLLQVRGITIGFVLLGLLADRNGMDGGNQRRFEPKSLRLEDGRDFAHGDLDAAIAWLNHIGARGGHNDGHEDQNRHTDDLG